MMTQHSVMTSSLRIKIDKFCDFSSYIDYNSKTDVFRVIPLLLLFNVILFVNYLRVGSYLANSITHFR